MTEAHRAQMIALDLRLKSIKHRIERIILNETEINKGAPSNNPVWSEIYYMDRATRAIDDATDFLNNL